MSGVCKLGLVGAGAISRAYAAAIAESPRAKLVAVADTSSSAADAFAAETGATPFASHLDLARSETCDAVIVTTPPVTHERIVVDLVARGIPVLCEKPLSVDLPSAQRMEQAAQASGVLLSMASKFRFTADVIAARDMIRAGEIGRPLMLENVFTGVVDMTDRWNSDVSISGGGVLIDNGTHSVDIIRYLVGPIEEVLAIAAPRLQPVSVEDTVTLLARTKSGVQASVETSWSIHKDRSAFIGIYGTEGVIEVGWKGSRIRRQHGGVWEKFGNGYDKVASFRRQIEHFVGVIGGEAIELVEVADALASVAVIQSAYRSMASGKWERVGEADIPSNRIEAAQ